MPKSTIFAKSGSVSCFTRKTLSGFRSRWTIPAACARARPFEHLRDDVHRLAERDAPRPPEPLAEVLAAEQLHHEVRAAVVAARVEHRDDVRALDGAHRARLAREPRDDVLVGRELRVDELDRDALAEPDVLGLVDGAHAAMTDETAEDVATRDRLADERLAGCPRALPAARRDRSPRPALLSRSVHPRRAPRGSPCRPLVESQRGRALPLLGGPSLWTCAERREIVREAAFG